MKVVFPEPAMPTQTMATGCSEREGALLAAAELSGAWADAMVLAVGMGRGGVDERIHSPVVCILAVSGDGGNERGVGPSGACKAAVVKFLAGRTR